VRNSTKTCKLTEVFQSHQIKTNMMDECSHILALSVHSEQVGVYKYEAKQSYKNL
jgi:hypothetical protein